MFSIEYDNGLFVNGIDIQWVSINNRGATFTLKGDTNSAFIISAEYCKTFFNQLQALNTSITNIESCWYKLNT